MVLGKMLPIFFEFGQIFLIFLIYHIYLCPPICGYVATQGEIESGMMIYERE
jgi:uncharacterized protein (DUF2225 family)